MTVVGREVERARIEEALGRALQGRVELLWIEGDEGAGKTTLCEYAASCDPKWRAVRATGVEGEEHLAFAGLSVIVRVLWQHVDGITDEHRHTLAHVLLLSERHEPDRVAQGEALLDLLASAAEQRPVLLVLDDVQWLDSLTMDVLSFALRRLDNARLAVVAAGRQRHDGLTVATADDTIHLEGLDAAAAAVLLAHHGFTGIAHQVVQEILAASQGLPLGLLEVMSRLTIGQRTGVAPLPDPLPFGPRTARSIRRRLESLPIPSREALAVLAAAGASSELLSSALSCLDLSADALIPAEAMGVVVTDGPRIRFSSPLFRALALHVVGPAGQRAAHEALALAAADDPCRRAVHLAAAALGPSESVADALTDAAREAERRGGMIAAGPMLEQAALFTPAGERRLGRQVTAAKALTLAGKSGAAVCHFDEVLAASTDRTQRAAARLYRRRALRWAWPDSLARRWCHIDDRVHRRPGSGGSTAFDRIEDATQLVATGRLADALSWANDAARCAANDGAMTAVLFFRAWAQTLAGGRHDTATVFGNGSVDEWVERIGHLSLDDPLHWVVGFAAQALVWSERSDDAVRLCQAAIDVSDRWGAPVLRGHADLVMTEALWWQGRWTQAVAAGQHAVARTTRLDQPLLASLAGAMTARALAGQGSDLTCRALVRSALGAAEQHEVPLVRIQALYAVGLLELGFGNVDEAARRLQLATRIKSRIGLREPTTVPCDADLVEALIRSSDRAGARDALAALEEMASEARSEWATAVAARCRAMLSRGDEADRLFHLAIAHLPVNSFDAARSQLCWGEHLRRRRARDRSRQVLAAAATTFEELGARPWAERTYAELRAAGVRMPADSSPSWPTLTPQERNVAEAVAQGLSNREVAAALFVSQKTVEYHLSHVYAKAGVASRTELVNRLAHRRAPQSRVL